MALTRTQKTDLLVIIGTLAAIAAIVLYIASMGSITIVTVVGDCCKHHNCDDGVGASVLGKAIAGALAVTSVGSFVAVLVRKLGG
jgi:hypothetical protein